MPLTMTSPKPATHLRCPSCGHAHPPRKSGLILHLRLGPDKDFSRILGRCSGCGKMKFLISEPAGQIPPAAGAPSADRELTLQELAAYVSEGTMNIDTAEAIAASPAPEPRKREIAAHVAEGALNPSDARRLLAI